MFVEEFILDHTLEPALKERPLEGFKLIDPTCGSGHFLLGAFHRLVDRWNRTAPGMEPRTRVNQALESIYGVDLNPFAVAIAKFRLIVAAMQAAGDTSLINTGAFTLNVHAGDSLLFGPERGGALSIDFDDISFNPDAIASSEFAYTTEDVKMLQHILWPGQYDVVVGNPPYINVKDKTLNQRYRQRYQYCKGPYALSVPFMEKFFELGRRGGEQSGWIGQITSNSFMKREFGVPLVEEFFPKLDLQLVVDSSGAYIPGHGTPTVILVGRNREVRSDTVRAVLGIQGEPGAPEEPSQGKVWSSIVKHADQTGHEDQWISVVDLPRENLAEHPWSLAGGGAIDLQVAIESASATQLSDATLRIGVFGMSNCDAAMTMDSATLQRYNLENPAFRHWVIGENIRDFQLTATVMSWFPYTGNSHLIPIEEFPKAAVFLWRNRTELGSRATFNKVTYFEEGRPWHEWHQVPKSDNPGTPTITFAFVATHNHFVLDRGGKVFNRSAPVIKLPEDATEDDHLRLLGVLNSSTACFWLKQNSYPKGGDPIGKGGARVSAEAWSDRYEFTGTTLLDYPLPALDSLARARLLDDLAQAIAGVEPVTAIERSGATRGAIEAARAEHGRLRAVMIAEQDELDWEVYRLYGLVDEDLTMSVGESPSISPGLDTSSARASDYSTTNGEGPGTSDNGVASAPGIGLGERAFEIALARRMAAGEVETAWFERHGSTPITEIPAHWPEEYRNLVQRRLDVIESNPFINLLERPEYKRRWAGESWDTKLQRALADWLLDKLEDPKLWFTSQGTPQPRSVGELAGIMERDPEFLTALDLWADRVDTPVTETLVKLLADQGVPYLAALRYKESGMRKRADWEHVWDLQRKEDAGLVNAEDIPVPPKYTTADFRKPSYWAHRGKLDVPKERFILYPDAGKSSDPTPLLGWAGWNHAQQGLALAVIYAEREADGAPVEQLIPIVAGINELLPWVKQWHSGIDPALGVDLADYLQGQLTEKAGSIGVPIPELTNWRPPAPTRGRRKKAATTGKDDA